MILRWQVLPGPPPYRTSILSVKGKEENQRKKGTQHLSSPKREGNAPAEVHLEGNDGEPNTESHPNLMFCPVLWLPPTTYYSSKFLRALTVNCKVVKFNSLVIYKNILKAYAYFWIQRPHLLFALFILYFIFQYQASFLNP